MLWLILPTSILALFIGCRKHRRWSIACTAALGILILVAVAFFGHDWFGLLGEKIATTVAGIILALSHYLNFRACQSISCSDKNCASKHHH
jgi:peptidoglycan/LPS O-acetylase OafA/YrhL